MSFNKYILAGLVFLTLSSCEDVIDVEVNEGEIQLSIDAFINNKAEVQKIILLETKQFFSEDNQVIYKCINRKLRFSFINININNIFARKQ